MGYGEVIGTYKMADNLSIEKIVAVLATPEADQQIQEARARQRLVQRQKRVAELRTRRASIESEALKVLPALRAEVDQLREAAQRRARLPKRRMMPRGGPRSRFRIAPTTSGAFPTKLIPNCSGLPATMWH